MYSLALGTQLSSIRRLLLCEVKVLGLRIQDEQAINNNLHQARLQRESVYHATYVLLLIDQAHTLL